MMKTTIPLFDSLIKQLDMYQDLRKTIEEIIYQGKRVPFSPVEKSINLGMMFGFLREENGQVVLSNRIFEMYLMNLFITEESLDNKVFDQGERDRNQSETDHQRHGKLLSGSADQYSVALITK